MVHLTTSTLEVCLHRKQLGLSMGWQCGQRRVAESVSVSMAELQHWAWYKSRHFWQGRSGISPRIPHWSQTGSFFFSKRRFLLLPIEWWTWLASVGVDSSISASSEGGGVGVRIGVGVGDGVGIESSTSMSSLTDRDLLAFWGCVVLWTCESTFLLRRFLSIFSRTNSWINSTRCSLVLIISINYMVN